MKIGIDARFYGTIGKGLGRYVEKLIAALERCDGASEHEFVIFLRRENFDAYQPAHPNFRKVLADYSWYSFAEQLGFVWRLYQEKLDMVHFPHFNVPILYRRPFVVTVHDLILLHYPTLRASTHNWFWYHMKFFAYRQTIRSALLRAREVLTVSEFTERDLLHNYPFLREKPVCVTYQASDAFCRWQSDESAEEYFKQLGCIDADRKGHEGGLRGILRPYALYVGNAYPHKNLELLVRAAGDLSRQGVRLVLVGRSDYFYERLKRSIGYLDGSRGDIVFAGGVDDNELALLYRYARMYVFPSLYEGFGLPPLEAMTYGVPVVASNRTSLPEILGDAAEYFDPEDIDDMRRAMVHVWTDEPLRLRLMHAGFERISRYSWDRLGRQTLKTYIGQ